MGQTLTHGIYLPDEGERNCYSGLAANWQILDSSVGTIAAHTAALSGKAPLVHTHVKSDITDLFNSANVWTGYNTYSKTITVEKNSDTNFFLNAKHTGAELGSLPSSDQSITWAFKDKNDDNLCYARVYYETTGGNSFRIFVRNKYASGAPSTSGSADYAYFGLKINADKSKEGVLRGTFRPYDNNTYDLGSSAYQWNNIYAKNYYYNGTAWGLNKANVWSAWQTQEHTTEPLIKLRRSNLQIGDPIPASQQIIGTIPFADKNNLNLGLIACRDNTNGDTYLTLIARQRYDSNGRANNGTQYESRIDLGIDSSKNLYLRPNSNGQINLGTSTNKWKTLNGINPGALSLPGVGGYTDIKGDITNLSGGNNTFTAPYDGWVCVKSANATVIHIINTTWAVSQSATRSTAGTLCCLCPVMSGQSFNVIVNATSLEYAYIHPCKGNV